MGVEGGCVCVQCMYVGTENLKDCFALEGKDGRDETSFVVSFWMTNHNHQVTRTRRAGRPRSHFKCYAELWSNRL